MRACDSSKERKERKLCRSNHFISFTWSALVVFSFLSLRNPFLHGQSKEREGNDHLSALPDEAYADDRFSLSFLCWPCEGKTWAVKTILFPFIHCGPLIEKERERPTMLRWNERNSFSNPLMHFFLYSDSHLTESSLPPRTIKRKDKRLFVEEMVDGCQYEKKWIPCG